MSYKQITFDKVKSQNEHRHFWRAASRLTVISRFFAFVAALLSVSFLFGVAAPSLTRAQTVSASGLPLDANGWTVFTASPNTQIIYISNSTGSDSTGVIGDVNHPYKTIAKGLSLLRNGYPDWLLLKKGDSWIESNQITVSGLSAAAPMVISSYDPTYPGVVNPSTGGARPLIKVSGGAPGGLYAWANGAGNYTAIVGIEFYAYDRDPNSTAFNPATVASSGPGGIGYLSPYNWLLIEDCKLSFFNGNMSFEAYYKVPNGKLILRRNVVTDSYSGQGLLAGRVTGGVFLEENLFDHNGWNATVTGAGPTAFVHNIYIAGFDPDGRPPANGGGGVPNSGDLSIVTARGNIISNDASGSQFRSGGIVDNNLFVHNPYPHNFSAPIATANYVTNNVYLEGFTGLGTGWGPVAFAWYNDDYYNIGTVQFSNNIIANAVSSSAGIAVQANNNGSGVVQYPGSSIIVDKNITFNWAAISDYSAGGAVITNDISDPSGSNTGIAPDPTPAFPDPKRSVGSYYDSIVGGSGHTSADFLAAVKGAPGTLTGQSKANWTPKLMAAAVNDYIRAGFAVTSSATASSPGASADTIPPTVPTGLAATAVSDTQITLSWIASTDNVGVTGYNVFRNGAKLGTTASTSYQDNSGAAGTTYTYTVSAYDAAGTTSALSSSVSVTTSASTVGSPPSVAISSPTNGSILNGSANIAVSANSANGIASITITADGNPLATCANVVSCSTTWQKKKITQGTHAIGAIATDAKGLPANASVTIVTR